MIRKRAASSPTTKPPPSSAPSASRWSKCWNAATAFSHDQASLLSLAEGHYPGTRNEREGIVIRPQTENTSTALGGRLSFKAISNRFLLKGGD